MLPLENVTVGQLLDRTAQLHHDRPALWYQARYWTYREFSSEINSCAAALAAWGIRKGDHVGIWGEMEPEVVCTFYALQKIGAIAVMLNTSLTEKELIDQVRLADVTHLCVGSNYKVNGNLLTICREIQERLGHEHVITVGEKPYADADSLSHLRSTADGTWLQRAQQMADQVSSQDTAVILFTSGSTSLPKAVMSSHYSRVNGGIQQAGDMHCSERDRFCVALPMFHCFCISVNLFASLACGGCLCIPENRRTASILHTIEVCKCTMLSAVPAMYDAMIKKDTFQTSKVSSLRTGIIGGAYCPAEQFALIEHSLGFTLLSSLGQTETTAGLSVCEMDDPLELRSATVGHFMNHVEGKVIDLATGAPLPRGQRGEICVRGYLTMQGYYKQPEATRQVLGEDGWLRTGDLGTLDEKGYITLCGRVKELIIRGGENISPSEIERALLTCPQVQSCKVVGVPDTHYGEEICACILPNPGQLPNEAELRKLLRERLAYYKIPRYMLFWKELPCTSTGKVSAKECARQAAAQLHLL